MLIVVVEGKRCVMRRQISPVSIKIKLKKITEFNKSFEGILCQSHFALRSILSTVTPLSPHKLAFLVLHVCYLFSFKKNIYRTC